MKTRTTRTERNLRAAAVSECLKSGPKNSAEIASLTGMEERAVIGALTGLFRDGDVSRSFGKSPKSGRLIWTLTSKPNQPKKPPKPKNQGITDEDMAWMADGKKRATDRRERVRKYTEEANRGNGGTR